MGDVGLMGMHVPGMSWREMREAAILAEELGYSCISMGESWGEDALTSLAQLAAVTSRIRIGTSIVPVFARSPANLAMAALNLDRMSEGASSSASAPAGGSLSRTCTASGSPDP
jgi:alkanesulfonate monooxygenase SsuD/methylene tetrahydromethanopterin reductase-like flavin-dependent oxidoreductase (luciferase family)